MRIFWGTWLLGMCLLAACDAPRPVMPPPFSPTPMPAPTALWAAAAPDLPPDFAASAQGEPGGLEGVFITLQNTAGANATQCYTLYRFFADGLLLGARACFDPTQHGADWPSVHTWLTAENSAENSDVLRGDYFRQDERVLLRIVDYDSLERAPYLRLARGEICGDKMMLQRLVLAPATLISGTVISGTIAPDTVFTLDRDLAPIGSTPVTELRRVPLPSASPSVLSPTGESPVQPTPGAAHCRVASWQFEWQTGIGLAGHDAEYRMRTDPGVQCTLHYTPPSRADTDTDIHTGADGGTPPTLPAITPATGAEGRAIPGTGVVTADATGLCAWRWPLGDVAGTGIVTVAIDTIVQDYAIVVNGPRTRE